MPELQPTTEKILADYLDGEIEDEATLWEKLDVTPNDDLRHIIEWNREQANSNSRKADDHEVYEGIAIGRRRSADEIEELVAPDANTK